MSALQGEPQCGYRRDGQVLDYPFAADAGTPLLVELKLELLERFVCHG